MMHNLYTNPQDIVNWLTRMGVENFTIDKSDKYGFIVNVGGDVYLNEK